MRLAFQFVAEFAKNDHDSLYRRILTKYKSSKLFWRILEDNKQDKRENPGKKTVRIAEPAIHKLSDTLQTQRIPSRLAFCLQSLAYFDEFYL